MEGYIVCMMVYGAMSKNLKFSVLDMVDIDYILKRKRVIPRQGNMYQAEIPSLIPKSELLKNPVTWISGDNNEVNKSGSSLANIWSETDVKSFVLGLYTFDRNFLHIKNFMEKKDMEEILSFYYGNWFYKSEKYNRWKDCRKNRRKRCVMFGRKIFTGRRMHQLLSTLYPQISNESQTTLLEVSMLFERRKTSIKEYLAYLKEIVGINVLVEAVGISKDEQIGNNNQSSRFVPPNGKAFSSLTLTEITQYLSGSFRLNNAWCEDIFWDAVWPRLSARGWSFERPTNQGYVANAMVFLVPGIKKFSRRDLVKRTQYFDSIRDVLDKVVSEPNLIELQNDENKEENERVREEPLEENIQLTVGINSGTNEKENFQRKQGEGQEQDRLQVAERRKSYKSKEANVPLVKRPRLTTCDTENLFGGENLAEGQWYSVNSHLGTEKKISAICIDLTDVGLVYSANMNETMEGEKKTSENRIDLTAADSAIRQPYIPTNEQPAMASRRGTRNRLLSRRALEALQTRLNLQDRARKPLKEKNRQ
ncbi:hypothetical protein ACFE04_021323 [Oxalis oulophora]